MSGTIASRARRQDPAKKAADAEASPEKQLEGLGFSMPRRKAARAAPASSAWSAKATSSSTCSTARAAWAAKAASRCEAVKAELIRSLEHLDTRPPVPDRLLQRAAGRFQSHRHARPAGLRHRREQAAGDRFLDSIIARRRHGPRGRPAAGHSPPARRDLLPDRRRRPEAHARPIGEDSPLWRRASSSTPSSSGRARSRTGRVFWPTWPGKTAATTSTSTSRSTRPRTEVGYASA